MIEQIALDVKDDRSNSLNIFMSFLSGEEDKLHVVIYLPPFNEFHLHVFAIKKYHGFLNTLHHFSIKCNNS